MLVGIVGALIAVAAACSNQGEGERCEANNNNEDCRTDEGLICYPKEQLKTSSSDRCCPLDRTKATTTVCKTSVEVGGGDATAPADTGPPPTTDGGTSDAEAGLEDAGGDADAAQ